MAVAFSAPQFLGARATGFLELSSPLPAQLELTSQESAWNFLVGVIIVLATFTRFNDQFLSPLLITAAMGGL